MVPLLTVCLIDYTDYMHMVRVRVRVRTYVRPVHTASAKLEIRISAVGDRRPLVRGVS